MNTKEYLISRLAFVINEPVRNIASVVKNILIMQEGKSKMQEQVDEQKVFRKMNSSLFLEGQVIHDKKDRQKYNDLYTNAFRNAFKALVAQNYEESPSLCKKLKRKCFMWLLFEEFTFFCRVNDIPFSVESVLSKGFGYSDRKIKSFLRAVREKLPRDKFASKSYSSFTNFVAQEKLYGQYPVKHIAVCATMSAGKSTFVNALLGRDVLPARNEATTAKITSVYDKDGLSGLLGFVQKADGNIGNLCYDVQSVDLNEWNNSPDVRRVFLQGDLDGIHNKNMIVAVHDTPGTNNSGDISHHDVTIQFLQENRMDAIVYVANATQLCTVDERALLSEIFRTIVQPYKLPVIFILNKSDEIDEDKENIADVMDRYKKYLSDIGFISPVLFPVSSKSARLLKMVQNGKAESLTAKESRALKGIQEQYKDIASTGITAVEQCIENLF